MVNKRPVFAINWNEVNMLVEGHHDNPHHILGMHETIDGVYINAYFPGAESVKAIAKTKKKVYELKSERVAGFFSIKISDASPFLYEYEVCYLDGTKKILQDAYNYDAVINPIDISEFNDGICYDIYKKLGSHPYEIDGESGVLFAVWAPHAQRVSVVGNFNDWNGRQHMMRRVEYSGIFELFVPGIKVGEIYKYEIATKNGNVFMKPDPYGNGFELRPGDASKVVDLSYDWTDTQYYEERRLVKSEVPMNIYEVHLGGFKHPTDGREFFNYREIAQLLADYVSDMGYTHVEIMPIMEHEQDGTLGYQTTGFYAPTSRYGEPADFKYFVDYLHKKGIGVICDWVPGQFPMNGGLACFDGEPLYEPKDPKKSINPRWGTYIFDYGQKEVRNYLISNALYWIDEYHLDGLKIDHAASMLYLDYGKSYGEWIPNEFGGNENLDAIAFFKDLNELMNEKYPTCMMIVEEESGWPMMTEAVSSGGMGFDYRYNMSCMQDLLSYMALDPLYRKYEHKKLVNSLTNAYDERYILEFSHSEVVGGKGSIAEQMPGGYEEKFSNLRLLYGYMMMHPGKKLLFMGQEFAQFKEFSATTEVGWDLLEFAAHRILKNYVKALNHLYKSEPALYELDNNAEGFEWINSTAADESIVSFLRKSNKKEETLLIICNFTPVTYTKYKVGVPYQGNYKEVFCSDLEEFGGNGSLNKVVKVSKRSACDGRKNSITIDLAPLSMSIFKLTDEAPVSKKSSGKTTTNENGNVESTTMKKSNVRSTTTKKTSNTKGAATKKSGNTKGAATKKNSNARSTTAEKTSNTKGAVTKKSSNAKKHM